MLIAGLLMVVGFIALYFGANWLVSGASQVADRLGLAKSFVGLTLVALGTSAPELFVNLIAASQGHTDFALANVAGSNLTNLCVGFGVIAMFTAMPVPRPTFGIDQWLMLGTCVLVLGFLAFGGGLPLWSSVLLLALLVFYVRSLAMRSMATEEIDSHHALPVAIGIFVGGVAALYVGAELVFRQALTIAHTLALSEEIIGLTIVACGTSIPDVVASVVAARKGENEIAVGNLLGSNIANVLVVLNGTVLASRSTLTATGEPVLDFTAVCVAAAVFLAVVLWRQSVSRPLGIGLLVAFVAYMVWRVAGSWST